MSCILLEFSLKLTQETREDRYRKGGKRGEGRVEEGREGRGERKRKEGRVEEGRGGRRKRGEGREKRVKMERGRGDRRRRRREGI